MDPLRDLRHTLIEYVLQQNRFVTGEDKTIENEEDVRRHARGMPLLTDLSLYENRSSSVNERNHGICDSDIRSCSDIRVP